MSLEEGSVECMVGGGGALCVCTCTCVCVSLPLYRRDGRAAWQNHYGLCKHMLTSPLESALPHHTHAHTGSEVYIN